MKVPSIEAVSYVPALFGPNLYGIPIDGQGLIRLHVFIKFLLEAGFFQEEAQIVRIDFVCECAIGRKFMTFCLLGDASLEGTLYGVTGQIVGALMISASR